MNIPKYKEELDECYSDPIYFIEKYCLGILSSKLYPYNKEVVRSYKRDKKIIVKASRQMGKTLIAASHIVWSILFKSNQRVILLSPKLEISINLLRHIQEIYNRLPKWMIATIIKCTRNEFILNNGSRISVQPATLDTCKGMSGITLLCVDEMDFIDPIIQNYILFSVAPFAEQVILLSTINPRNYLLPHHFQTFGSTAALAAIGKNDYTLHVLCWNRHPDHDDEFKSNIINMIGLNGWYREYEINCS